jgi:hypothetical protein
VKKGVFREKWPWITGGEKAAVSKKRGTFSEGKRGGIFRQK